MITFAVFCGLVTLWDYGIGVSWECRFASHGHAVVIQLLDRGEEPMAIENSDTVMPKCRNPSRLDMADTAEAGTGVPSRGLTGHVAERYVVAHVSAELVRQWVARVLAKGLPVSEEQMMSSLVLRVMTEAQGC